MLTDVNYYRVASVTATCMFIGGWTLNKRMGWLWWQESVNIFNS